MAALAELDAGNKEKDASEADAAFDALLEFVDVAEHDFDEWTVDSDDNCDCVMLDPKNVNKPKLVDVNEEQCFPLYHDLHTKTKGITDNFEQGNLDVALQLAKKLMETHPHYSRGFAWAATIEAMRGNDHASFEYLRRASAANNQNPFVAAALAMYHHVHGNFNEARQLNIEALKIDPNQEFARGVQMDYLETAFGVKYEAVDP